MAGLIALTSKLRAFVPAEFRGGWRLRLALRRWRLLRSPSDSKRMMFDPDWYLRTYPDVAAAGIDPLQHYVKFGAAEGRDPSPLFRTRWYLETYPDVAHAGLNPLQHYLSHGAAEGRLPMPNNGEPEFARRGPSQGAIAAAMNLIKEFSDTEFELARWLDQPLDALPVAPDLSESLAEGWRSLYLSLDRVPRVLLIVPSLDEERLRRHLLCLCNHAIASGDPSALLVIAVDETFPSVGMYLPRGVTWRSLAEFRPDLDFQQKVAILIALIHGLRPQALLVLDSQAGWEALAQQGTAICRYSGLFAACVSPVQDAAKVAQDLGFEPRYLRQCLPSLAAVYASDPEWIEELSARCGLPAASRQKFRLLPTASCDAEWVSMLSREPGFLAKKRASRP